MNHDGDVSAPEKEASHRSPWLSWGGVKKTLLALAIMIVAFLLFGWFVGPPDYEKVYQQTYDACISQKGWGGFPSNNSIGIDEYCRQSAEMEKKEEFLKDHPELRKYAAPGVD